MFRILGDQPVNLLSDTCVTIWNGLWHLWEQQQQHVLRPRLAVASAGCQNQAEQRRADRSGGRRGRALFPGAKSHVQKEQLADLSRQLGPRRERRKSLDMEDGLSLLLLVPACPGRRDQTLPVGHLCKTRQRGAEVERGWKTVEAQRKRQEENCRRPSQDQMNPPTFYSNFNFKAVIISSDILTFWICF